MMAHHPVVEDTELADNFEFQLVGDEPAFASYVSQIDPTLAKPNVLVRGSKNVYKKLSNTIAVRDGLKLRGARDSTIAGTKASTEFIVLGNVRPLRINNGKMQVEVDTTGAGAYVWSDILTGLGSDTRFVFDSWWDDTNKKDVLLGVNGFGVLFAWSGGVGVLTSATTNTIVVQGSETLAQLGFDSSGTVVIGGVEYAYTGAGVSTSATGYTPTNNKIAISTSSWSSQLIATGAGATQILSATVRINNNTQYPTGVNPPKFICSIYSDNAGVPGTKLVSAQQVIGSGYGFSAGDFDLTFTFDPIPATPATNYHVVIQLVENSSSSTFSIYTGNSGSVGTNISGDAGATWSAQNGHMYCSMTENDVAAQTLVGVTPDPSALTVGTPIVQKIRQNPTTPIAGFAADFLRVINNQLHVGSYDSRLVYISSNKDYANYTVPTVRVAGDPDLFTLDSAVRGIAAQKGNSQTQVAVISGSEGDWYTVVRSNITVGTTLTEDVQVVKSESADLESALAHEFIDNVGDSIIFLDANNQLRQYGTVRNVVTPVYPLLSLDVYDELRSIDFTGGHLRSVGDTVYITAPLIGTDYMYQVRSRLDEVGNQTAERIWHPPQIRSVARIAVIDGVVYGHSTANPQLYQLWDTEQWHDDSPGGQSLSYECRMLLAYGRQPQRSKNSRFDKAYYEGYILEGTKLFANVYQDYQGSSGVAELVICDATQGVLPTFYTGYGAPSLGDESLGDDTIGDGNSNVNDFHDTIPKFRTILGMEEVDCYEYALEMWSNDADSYWEALALGVNAISAPNASDELTQ